MRGVERARLLAAMSPKSEVEARTGDVESGAGTGKTGSAGKCIGSVAAIASFCNPGRKRTAAEWFRLCRYFGLVLVASIALAMIVLEIRARPPEWEMESFTIDRIDVPGLWMNGIVAANISACPAYDPCGIALARGCSVCPHAGDINRGCLCSDKGGHPGMVVSANVTACSLIDSCGIYDRSCAFCPDETFVRNGCMCHKPMSLAELRQQAVDFYEMLSGIDECPAQVRLRTEMQVKNPNYAHARTERGNLSVSWNGNVIATTAVEELSLPARGMDVIPVEVDINHVTRELGYDMMQTLLSNGWRLTLQAEGMVAAEVMFTEVLTDIVCNITAEVNMDGTSKIAEQDCDYTYRGLGGAFEMPV